MSAEASKVAAAVAPAVKEEPKSFARRDRLRDIEKEVQARWAAAKEFEANAPADGDKAAHPKYMATFPYPYMNGRLHLGHAFTVTKADFAAGYQRLRGKNVLFPFAFHCTGMPIQAAANKLSRELDTGSYLKMREAAAAAAAEAASAAAAEEAAPAAAPADEPAAAAASAAPAVPAFKDPNAKFGGKKTKAVAKAGGPGLSQYDILLKSGIPESEIPAFRDPKHWLAYFPPLGKRDLASFGCHVDWRRSFVTTDANPFYDSFIRWQFNTLRKRGKLGFGKRPTVYSALDGQPCMDHERASGEGVAPQEYTLIKIRVRGIPADHPAAARLAPLAALIAAGRNVYLVAATLRPETMYGQTNCFLLPEGEYGAFDVSAEGGGDVFLCSERSARNMSYQGLSRTEGVIYKEGESYTGADLLGLPLAAPYAPFETVYSLPLLTISMKKGTGVVTSVPSDAPDDWAALRDLKEKQKLREKYGIPDAAVLPFDPIPIIDIPGFGTTAALKVCDDLKIRSQNDKVLLAEAKDRVYMAGFYQGTMLVGKYAGRKVCDAKALVRADMMAEGHAAVYREPESEVVSRSGDECVVAMVDQWYLTYGEDEWRSAVEAWVKSPHFRAYSEKTQASFESTIAWLKEWACSRSFGLGTRVPWDATFLIESLSDSTIYMAYYTVAHLLQGGDIDPATNAAPGPAGIKAEDLTDAVWDYIFLDGGATAGADATPLSADCPIPRATLDAMRREFEYWYPMDLRVSGKDLIGNHLTMSLYNHAAIWQNAVPGSDAAGAAAAEAAPAAAGAGAAAPAAPAGRMPRADRMPQSFFCNGHVQVDGEKMAKQRGNFLVLEEAIERWGADATRIALADAGDGLEDANFERDSADNTILRLTNEEDLIKEFLAEEAGGKLRGGALNFPDAVFEARINTAIASAEAAYEGMRFRDALQLGFYLLQKDRDTYRDMCIKVGVPAHAGLMRRFYEVQYVLLAPIAPHFCEHVWGELLGHKEVSVTRAPWPRAEKPDTSVLRQDEYLQSKLHAFRVQITKALVGKPKGGKSVSVADVPKPTDVNIYVATRFSPLQQAVVKTLAPLFNPAAHAAAGNNGFPADVMNTVKTSTLADPALKAQVKKAMEFAALVVAEHKDAAEPTPVLRGELPFDEFGVWSDNREFVAKALDIPSVHVLRVEDEGVLASDTTGKAKDVVPGAPHCLAFTK